MKNVSKYKIILFLVIGFIFTSESVFADITENNLNTLETQQEYFLNTLIELEILIERSSEKILDLSKQVNANTDKLIEETDIYMTILEEIDVLNKVLNEIINQKSNSELIYEYDVENRLKVIRSKKTNVILYEFEYDGNGNLLKVKKH